MTATYDQVPGLATEIYQKAVDKYLSDTYQIYKDGDTYYSPDQGGDAWNPSSRNSRYTDDQLKQLVSEAQHKFADVPHLFDDFSMLPDPAGFDNDITMVSAVMDDLCAHATADPILGIQHPINTELSVMAGTTAGQPETATVLQRWDGLASEAFLRNFVTPFPDRTANQFTCASVLLNALKAEAELWKRARLNIADIAEKTKNGLDHYADCGKNDWTVGLSVVGAVVTIASAIATGGTSLVVGLAAVGAAGTVASTVAGTSDSPPSDRYGGESVEAVINSCRKAVADLKTAIKEQEQKVVDAMTKSVGIVEAHKSDFIAPRPSLADGSRVGQPGDN